MTRIERPTLRIKFELETPDQEFYSRKFCVSRTMKAKWSNDHDKVTNEVLQEIKNYRGSFVGDIIQSLNSISCEDKLLNPTDLERSTDIARWISSMIESMILTALEDELHKNFIDEKRIQEADGSYKTLNKVTKQEIKRADVEKIMLLLGPSIKHMLSLISKSVDENV